MINGDGTSGTSGTNKAENKTLTNQNNINPNAQNNNSEPGDDVNSITGLLKLPPFWSRCPSAWFVQVENAFALRKITLDTRKFQYVLAGLPEEIVMSVLDVIQSDGNGQMYKTLKETLISRHSVSERRRLDSLFSKADMGDQKPSEFYRHLELMAGDPKTFDRNLLIKLWMSRLPKSIEIALMGSGKTDLSEVLPLADKIWDASSMSMSSVASLASGSHTQPAPPTSNAQQTNSSSWVQVMTDMCTRMASLEREIGELRASGSHYGRSNERSRPQFRNRSKSRRFGRSGSRPGNNNHPYCWYHFKFGAAARDCRQPCSFGKSTSSDGQSKKN